MLNKQSIGRLRVNVCVREKGEGGDETYLRLTTDHNEYEYAVQCIYQIGKDPNIVCAIEIVFVCP